MEALLSRISACGTLFKNLGEAEHTTVSRAQATHILMQLDSMRLGVADLAAVASAVADAGFEAADIAAIRASISKSASSSNPASIVAQSQGRGRKAQNYENVFMYMPEYVLDGHGGRRT